MTSKSKRKGSAFELKIVKLAREYGLESKRTPLSGALPEYPEDVVIEGRLYQCKKRKEIPKWLKYPKAEGVIIEENYGEPLILLPLKYYLQLLKERKYGIPETNNTEELPQPQTDTPTTG